MKNAPHKFSLKPSLVWASSVILFGLDSAMCLFPYYVFHPTNLIKKHADPSPTTLFVLQIADDLQFIRS